MRNRELIKRTLPLAFVAALICPLLLPLETPVLAAAEPGTIGAGFSQLYSEDQTNHRGELVVLSVRDGLPAAKAGMLAGDVVTKINGADVAGRVYAELSRKELRGPVGSTLRLTLVRPSTGKTMELELTRVPYPIHENPASDSFHYALPGSWPTERYPFPLEFAPTISHKGLEDLAFVPEFGDTLSPQYHSYIFFWWLEGNVPITPDQLRSDLIAYFTGLSKGRAEDAKFAFDSTKITASFKADPGADKSFAASVAQSFFGDVTLYDSYGKVITLHCEVVTSFCKESNHTALFFGLSGLPRTSDIWNQLDNIRDSFQCHR